MDRDDNCGIAPRETLARWANNPSVVAARMHPPPEKAKGVAQERQNLRCTMKGYKPFDAGVEIVGETLRIRNQYTRLPDGSKLDITVTIAEAQAAVEGHGGHGDGLVSIPSVTVPGFHIGYGKLASLLKSVSKR